LHFENNKYVSPIDFEVFLCFSADPTYVTIDTTGYRSGAMNESLNEKQQDHKK